MTTGRERLQIVEIDVDYCPLTYGTTPCGAVLGTDGVRKCYNTYATCQNVTNFGRLAEPDSTPAEYVDQDTITGGSAALDQDLFAAVDVVIGDDPDGVIWELGGSTNGLYLGFTSGEVVLRAGEGASVTTETADLRADPTDILSKTGSFYVKVDVSAGSVALWFYEPETKTLKDFGSAVASAGFPGGAWGGSNQGGFGRIAGGVPSGETTTDFNGTCVALRIYDTTTFTPSTEGNTLTLRYAHNQSGLPFGVSNVFPALKSVSVRGTQINLGGADPDLGSLGRRERITTTFQDFTHHDRGIDKYTADRIDGTGQTDESGYQPGDRGTHFGKLAARWPHYLGRPLRVKEGRVGEDLSAMETRNYVITEWAGPDASGMVQISAKDILSLAENDKALCPAPSDGQLLEDIEADSTTLTLTPTDIGEEYPTSGRICIGSEIMTFTREGDVMTLTARAVDGTEAASHSEGDTVQECYRCENRDIQSVMRDLLRDYADVDASFIPFSDWNDEGERWLAGFNLTTTIPKPVGVTKLLGELTQFGVVLWWDSQGQRIRMRANRPVDLSETVPVMSDSATVLQGSLSRTVQDDKRLTRVIVAHGVIDYTDNVEEPDNFTRLSIAVDPEAASGFEYGQDKTLWIYTRWLGAGKDSIANPVALRTLNRYSDPPEQLSFKTTSAERDNAVVASVVEMTSRLLTDETGRAAATQLQVTSVQDQGESLIVTAESFSYQGRYGYITENARSDYAASSASEKASGTYIVGASLTFGDGSGPYLIF